VTDERDSSTRHQVDVRRLYPTAEYDSGNAREPRLIAALNLHRRRLKRPKRMFRGFLKTVRGIVG